MPETKEQTPKKNGWWTNRAISIMLAVIIAGAAICIAMFIALGVVMSKSSNQTIDEVGEFYMKGMGDQVSQRYETAITLRLDMVEALVTTIAPGNDSGANPTVGDVRERLKTNAAARGFEFLAFYYVVKDKDGNDVGKMEMILGESAEITDPEPFCVSLTAGDKKVAVGSGVNDENTLRDNAIFMGVPTSQYTLNNGGKSVALVAGMTNDDIVEMLSMDREETTMVYSHIIRKDGSFVIRSADELHGYENYFTQIRGQFEEKSEEAERHINDLKSKMERDEVYSDVMNTKKGNIHMYCAKLAVSEWYLVTIMDYDMLDSIIEQFGNRWVVMAVVSSVILAAVLIAIFLLYTFFNSQNVKQLERAREDALRANRAKSEFLSNMSHDIRTPMNAIVGMTAIATANIDNKQQVQNCLKKIALSSRHLLGLINDVLDMSKIESGKMTLNMEQVSLREAIDGITTIVQPQLKIKKQNFNVFIHDIITENVYCDSVRLNQVLLNLLSNAIKFTPDEGKIEIALSQEESPLGEHFVRNHIWVSDTGIGMTQEFLKRIFESFTREDNARVHKTEGTGLGMTITKYIVDAMKGTIEVQSELGKGTKFHVTLDLERVETMEEEMILPDWHMLVVDDDEQLCESAVASLKGIGIRGEWTLSGEDAIDIAVKAHDGGNNFDIILLDWRLPGIDGIETARRIRKALGDDIPILLISAYDWSEMEDEAREAGISGFISKPLFKSTLFYGLRKYAEGATEAKEEKAIAKEEELAGKKILLAEDNDLNWEIADMLLTDAGLIVERAENGKICVEKLKNSAPGTYDAILMDIRMPVMTGYEATVEIRKLDHPDHDLPIIAMTADAFSDDMKKCLECGMNAHVAKPIDLELIKATLIKFISKRHS